MDPGQMNCRVGQSGRNVKSRRPKRARTLIVTPAALGHECPFPRVEVVRHVTVSTLCPLPRRGRVVSSEAAYSSGKVWWTCRPGRCFSPSTSCSRISRCSRFAMAGTITMPRATRNVPVFTIPVQDSMGTSRAEQDRSRSRFRHGTAATSPPDRLASDCSRSTEMPSVTDRTPPSPESTWNTPPASRDRGFRDVSSGDAPTPAPKPV